MDCFNNSGFSQPNHFLKAPPAGNQHFNKWIFGSLGGCHAYQNHNPMLPWRNASHSAKYSRNKLRMIFRWKTSHVVSLLSSRETNLQTLLMQTRENYFTISSESNRGTVHGDLLHSYDNLEMLNKLNLEFIWMPARVEAKLQNLELTVRHPEAPLPLQK